MRFRLVLVLLLVALGAFAGVAHALDFDDEDPHPPRADVGMVYSYEIGTHAGCLPHRLEIGAGSLPPGLSIRKFDHDTHFVEGVPTQAGVFSVWIHLRDCDNRSAETLFTFEVWERRWGIATQSLKPATVNSPYSMTLEGAGLPSDVTWEVTSGSLPAGLTLAPSGTISGTPTATGSSTFTVKATAKEKNFGPTRVDSRQFTLNVLGPLSATLSRTTAEARVRLNATLQGVGGQGPYTWAVRGLPAGLTASANGVITGVPRRAGSYTLTVQVTDASGSTRTVQVRLIVRKRLQIATTRVPSAASGSRYSARIATSGGVEGKRWSATGLPSGLKLSASTGRISGVPTRSGTFRVKVRVRDALGAVATKSFVLRVR